MGGVDRMDQNISAYRISICRKKRYQSLFTYLVDVTINNSFKLWKEDKATMDLLGFKRSVANVYLRKHASKPLRGKSPAQSKLQKECRFDRIDHLVLKQAK